MMKTASYRTLSMRFILVASIVTAALMPSLVQAQRSAKQELDEVWLRVQQSGAYRFSADIEQTTTPQATVANAGRESKQNQLYLEGENDLQAETLHLSLWSQGGSVLDPNTSLEIRVDGDQADARTQHGEWEAIDNFTGLFAPSGDFLAYTQSADNVVRHAPELRNTA